MADKPVLSIIITSFNLERLNDIRELMDAIKVQTYADFETIFIVERSTELLNRVKAYAQEKNIPDFYTIFNDGEPGLSAARNLGIKAAKGDIIGFVDDDVVLFPNWAEETVKSYTDSNVIGVTGPALPLWEDPRTSWFPEELYWLVSCTAWSALDKRTEVRNAWGMNMSFRREAFEQGRLFLPAYGLRDSSRLSWVDPPSEDVDLSIRVKRETGKSIFYEPAVRVKHRVYKQRLKFAFIRRRAFSVGYQRRMLKKLYPEANSGVDLLKQEHQLLNRILFHLFPDIFRTFFRSPITAWRKFSVTIVTLTFVGLGYYSHLLVIRR